MSTHALEDGEIFSDYQVQIYSNPSFLGYPIKREDLIVQHARIFDPKSRNFIGPSLRWVGQPDSDPFNVTIKAGHYASFYLFGIHKSRVHHYSGRNLHNIDLSETLIEIDHLRKLEIHITDVLGRTYRMPFIISLIESRNNMHKIHFDVRFKSTFSDRLRQLGNGFRQIWGAFFGPSY